MSYFADTAQQAFFGDQHAPIIEEGEEEENAIPIQDNLANYQLYDDDDNGQDDGTSEWEEDPMEEENAQLAKMDEVMEGTGDPVPEVISLEDDDDEDDNDGPPAKKMKPHAENEVNE
jgi:hypothetical protein